MSSLRSKNVVKYVLPAMLSSVCFFLFTTVDGIFIGRGVGTNGLDAINLISPFVMTLNALTMMLNIGGVTILAICIGKGDSDGANKAFRHGLSLLICVSALLSFIGVFFTDTVCSLLGAGETHHQLATEYLFWYSVFIIPSSLSYGLQNYCRNDGAPGLVGIANFGATACNIFGDWLLIFPFQMGMKGAAIATGVSQSLGVFVLLTHFIRKKGILRFGKIKLEGGMVKDIIIHGLTEGISQIATPVMTLCMNLVLVAKVGDIGVNAFSVIIYVASLSMAIFYGTSEGLQPLFGQSYGAKNEKELKFYYRTGLLICGIGSAAIAVLVTLIGRPISILFGAEGETLTYILKVLPQFAVGFIAMAFNVLICAYLYSTERSFQSTAISILRSIVVSAAVIMLLPEIFGVGVIWFSLLIYEAIVLAIAVVLIKHSERNGIVFK